VSGRSATTAINLPAGAHPAPLAKGLLPQGGGRHAEMTQAEAREYRLLCEIELAGDPQEAELRTRHIVADQLAAHVILDLLKAGAALSQPAVQGPDVHAEIAGDVGVVGQPHLHQAQNRSAGRGLDRRRRGQGPLGDTGGDRGERPAVAADDRLAQVLPAEDDGVQRLVEQHFAAEVAMIDCG